MISIIEAQIRAYCEKYSTTHAQISSVERSTYLNTIKPFDASDHIQGRLLSLLSHLLSPKLIVELGTFTAYATLSMAEGLHPDGRIISMEHTTALRPLIDEHLRSINNGQIEVQYGDAATLLKDVQGPIDMVFIDAAKRQYRHYHEAVVDKVRPGGLIIADNVLWKNEVINDKKNKIATALHEYNEMIAKDTRVDAFILPYRDGLSICRRL